jgi:hypothetical protein
MEEQLRELARQEAEKVFAEKFSALNQKTERIPLKVACKEFGFSEPTAYRHIEAGRLHLDKVGGKSYLRRSEIEALFVEVR